MARYRPSRAGRWWRALAGAAAYLVAVAVLLRFEITSAATLPPAVVVLGSLAVYTALSRLLARRTTLGRRAAWIGAACAVHALLAVLSMAAVAVADVVPPGETARHALAGLTPVLLALVATPLVLLPFGRRRARPAAPGLRRDPELAAPLPPPVTPSPAHDAPMPAPSGPAPSLPDAAVVRVSFARVAGQLAADAFVLPPERLAESLREPHVLVVPRELVLAQLASGAVEVDWAVVAPQFPALAFVGSEVEFRQQHPDLRLRLPLDEVVRQVSPETLRMPGSAVDVSAVTAFPPPFEPVPATDMAPAALVPVSPAPGLPAEMAVVRTAAIPPVAIAAPVPGPSAPARLEGVDVAPVAGAAAGAVDGADVGLVARVAAVFDGCGTLQAGLDRVDGVSLVALVAPGLDRAAVLCLASRAARFVGAGGHERVTLCTTAATVVVTAAATTIVVAAPRPGVPAAMLELRARQAAAALGGPIAGSTPPARALRALPPDAAASRAGVALESFGRVEPAVFADAAADRRVFVFSPPGSLAEPLGGLAAAVWEALGGAASSETGRLVSVVLGDRRRCLVVRPLGTRGLLAAAGPVTRPGRGHRDADRAAVLLEAP